jgi:DNA-binding IclR family transcriptional regulator
MVKQSTYDWPKHRGMSDTDGTKNEGTAHTSTIEKAFDILEIILNNNKSINASELANMIGVSISTVYRVISILIRRGYIIQKRKRGKYFVGPKIFEFENNRNTITIVDVAYSFMTELNSAYDEFVELIVLRGDKTSSVETIPSSKGRRLKIDLSKGQELPLYCTAPGKVLLAHMKVAERRRYFNSNILKARTGSTITDASGLKRQLVKIRREEVAFDHQEWELGIIGVASPVRSPDGNVVAVLSIAGPSARIHGKKMLSLASAVKISASNISKFLHKPLELG